MESNANGRAAGDASPVQRDLLIALVLFAIALTTRLAMLGNANLHIDEYHSFNYAQQSLGSLFALDRDTDIHPPLFFSVVKGWAAIFGDDRFVLRLLPALLSALAAPLFYVILRQFLDWKTAALAGLLFCIAPMQITYGRFLRMYPLLTLLYLVAFLCYLRTRKEDGALFAFREATPWLVILAGACLTLAFMTHYTAAFSFVCFAIIAVVQYLRGRVAEFRIIVAMLAVGTVLAIPQILHMLSQVGDEDMAWMRATTPKVFYQMSAGAYPYAWYMKPVMGLMLAWGGWQLWQRDRDMAIRIGIFMLAGPAVAAIVGIFQPVYLVRTIQIFTVFSSLLFALAILSVAARPVVAGVLAAICVVAQLQAIAPKYLADYQPSVIERHAAVSDAIDLSQDRVFAFFRLHREARYHRVGWFQPSTHISHKNRDEVPKDREVQMAEIEAAAEACFAGDPSTCRSVVIFAEVEPIGNPAPGRAWSAFLDRLETSYPVAHDEVGVGFRVMVLARDGRFPPAGDADPA